ncbi:hypothetical protein EV657_103191 [Rhodovulum visakhapatnamense]|uniref:Uncharacterized protein n=1 Tax=Rhodovulum visakhapatnamense TaxID=364297 RepID=A0A4R8G369_9RHOB|nr:hypothetical protein EV657_103191 [Rhodovulum visakhapatnamense]
MLISLHRQATTTPKIRGAIQASSEPTRLVAERSGISERTVWTWRGRDDVHARSHTPHRLQTTLTPTQGSSVKRSIRWTDRSEEGRRCAAQGASPAARRSARRGARIPRPACLALGPRPLPPAPRPGQPAGAEAEGIQARAWQLQGRRARRSAHRHLVSAHVSVTQMRALGGVVDEPGVEIGLERLDSLVEGLAHLHAEDLLQHPAVEALDEPVGLRRADLGAAVLDGVEVEIELVGVLFGAAEVAAVRHWARTNGAFNGSLGQHRLHRQVQGAVEGQHVVVQDRHRRLGPLNASQFPFCMGLPGAM